jgi:ELP3 family radical SAM enzyme/protein acetyltransferase
MRKLTRSWSGVLPISLALEGNTFSCKHNCSFCPSECVENGAEKTIARSYLSNEGTFLRGNLQNFSAFQQTIRRLIELESMGHYPDKLEIIILGGTWDCYSVKYRKEFIHDIYYACNIYTNYSKYFNQEYYSRTQEYVDTKPFYNKLPLPEFFFQGIRLKQSLQVEKDINSMAAGVRIIGIVIETRPDYITLPTILEKRRLGCTRIQLGIQHTDDEILNNNNRGHDFKRSVKAIKYLKNNCFKVDGHIMPDLPFTTIEKDYEMVDKIFKTQDCQLDYVKIYPCLELPYTQARKWKEEGIWKPYAETNYEDFVDLLAYTISIVPPWTRINRVQRDFPKATEKNEGLGYSSTQIETNLHQFVVQRLKEMNKSCYDIRTREIKKTHVLNLEDTCLYVRRYIEKDATEFFISLEVPKNENEIDDSILLGFIRLRIMNESPDMYNNIPILRDRKVARIRELHVYGFIHNTKEQTSIQHRGIGKFLLHFAEYISYKMGCHSVAIISGVGVRKYYEKQGYALMDRDKGEFMIKRCIQRKYWLTLFGNKHFCLPMLWFQENGQKEYDTMMPAKCHRYRSIDLQRVFLFLLSIFSMICILKKEY